MNRVLSVLAPVALSLLAGCASGTYQTNASPTQLSAYAGQASYPYDLHSEQAPHLFAMVAPDATVTIYNAGDESYSNFELWVNKSFTLHVDKLAARSSQAFAPDVLFNKSGTNLVNAPASSISTIQVYIEGKLWDVQGPIVPH